MEPAREIPGCITSGCALSVYGINFHPIMMCPLRRSVPVMIIPTHICVRAMDVLSDDTRYSRG